jgi:hypothetical protein
MYDVLTNGIRVKINNQRGESPIINNRMKTYKIQSRETGTFIEGGLTYDEAVERVIKFEDADEATGTFEPDFYEIEEEE